MHLNAAMNLSRDVEISIKRKNLLMLLLILYLFLLVPYVLYHDSKVIKFDLKCTYIND